jgi:hypothetical protein
MASRGRLVVLLVVVVQLLQFHVAIAHIFQGLVVLVLNRLGLHFGVELGLEGVILSRVRTLRNCLKSYFLNFVHYLCQSIFFL